MATLFKVKDAITRAIDAVMDHTKGWPQGRVLAWGTIRDLTGIHSRHPSFSAFRARLAKRFRRERDTVVYCLPDARHGLTLCTPAQVLGDVVAHRMRKRLRQGDRAIREMETVPATALSDLQKAQRAARVERIKRGQQQDRAVRKLVRIHDVPVAGMPRPSR